MRRVAALLAALGLAAAGVGYVHATEPGWWVRLWYPLKYESIVRGHARNYHLDPALLTAVIYQESKFRPKVKSTSGAIGLMQLLPDTAKGIAIHTSTTRRSISATARGTSATCWTSTGTSEPPWPPTTPARRTSTSGGARAAGSPSPRRATT